ncbi:MAG: urease accessory UreF family protein [Paracoccus sp. (in: a-proteobacteria)]|uniref:urease accessory protein UreF n=1 Tax=Paracoccus sp. TaxID=267 RepID=UPI0026E0E248|nr:urease accessory UreF family protein [Paracoccus sp. (in: a-proteobacteria)]MDO5612511.1 urease accessory UreF family protein [Paracoccus sp. (in: a-proteobacteria)]
MAAPLATATDAATDAAGSARLLAVQLLSPAFPTGAFAYAQGLEWAMDQGMIRDADGLACWLGDVLAHGAGWSDAVILSLALRPGADHAALDDLARALCLSSERLTDTLEQGAAFARTAAALTGAPASAAALPVAVGRALSGQPLPRAEVIALYLHGQALNLTLAAVRYLPLGADQGQALLHGLGPAILHLSARAADAGESDLGTCAIGAEIAQMRHETMQTRIFRT